MSEPAGVAEAFAATGHARFTGWLRERSEPAWTAATTHEFTEQLGKGTLADDAFARYLVQDIQFVEALTSVVGHAVGSELSPRRQERVARHSSVPSTSK